MPRYWIGNAEDIPRCGARSVFLNGRQFAVFHLSDGSFHAIENRCPHKGGPLSEGIVSGKYVFCPLHDWKIDVTDGRVQAPDRGCVRTYDVEIEGGKIYILLGEANWTEAG